MNAFPLEDAGIVDAVGEVFMGFELLEGASGLAGDFLGVGLDALGGGEFGEGGFGFGDAEPVKPLQCGGFPNEWNFPGWREVCEAIEIPAT